MRLFLLSVLLVGAVVARSTHNADNAMEKRLVDLLEDFLKKRSGDEEGDKRGCPQTVMADGECVLPAVVAEQQPDGPLNRADIDNLLTEVREKEGAFREALKDFLGELKSDLEGDVPQTPEDFFERVFNFIAEYKDERLDLFDLVYRLYMRVIQAAIFGTVNDEVANEPQCPLNNGIKGLLRCIEQKLDIVEVAIEKAEEKIKEEEIAFNECVEGPAIEGEPEAKEIIEIALSGLQCVVNKVSAAVDEGNIEIERTDVAGARKIVLLLARVKAMVTAIYAIDEDLKIQKNAGSATKRRSLAQGTLLGHMQKKSVDVCAVSKKLLGISLC